mmetsp:Transcript_12632/g.27298  ORF Transcript_12632/g.27298 Transcript_12632/m.27298 type:complete len:269 (-) Transcript_12632:1259-2065(-)
MICCATAGRQPSLLTSAASTTSVSSATSGSATFTLQICITGPRTWGRNWSTVSSSALTTTASVSSTSSSVSSLEEFSSSMSPSYSPGSRAARADCGPPAAEGEGQGVPAEADPARLTDEDRRGNSTAITRHAPMRTGGGMPFWTPVTAACRYASARSGRSRWLSLAPAHKLRPTRNGLAWPACRSCFREFCSSSCSLASIAVPDEPVLLRLVRVGLPACGAAAAMSSRCSDEPRATRAASRSCHQPDWEASAMRRSIASSTASTPSTP